MQEKKHKTFDCIEGERKYREPPKPWKVKVLAT